MVVVVGRRRARLKSGGSLLAGGRQNSAFSRRPSCEKGRCDCRPATAARRASAGGQRRMGEAAGALLFACSCLDGARSPAALTLVSSNIVIHIRQMDGSAWRRNLALGGLARPDLGTPSCC